LRLLYRPSVNGIASRVHCPMPSNDGSSSSVPAKLPAMVGVARTEGYLDPTVGPSLHSTKAGVVGLVALHGSRRVYRHCQDLFPISSCSLARRILSSALLLLSSQAVDSSRSNSVVPEPCANYEDYLSVSAAWCAFGDLRSCDKTPSG
jgi:hypothetical protein